MQTRFRTCPHFASGEGRRGEAGLCKGIRVQCATRGPLLPAGHQGLTPRGTCSLVDPPAEDPRGVGVPEEADGGGRVRASLGSQGGKTPLDPQLAGGADTHGKGLIPDLR